MIQFRVSQLGSTSGGGGNLGKMSKNCMKITKSAFLGQNSGGDMGGQANFLGSGGRSPPTRGNPAIPRKQRGMKDPTTDEGAKMVTKPIILLSLLEMFGYS